MKKAFVLGIAIVLFLLSACTLTEKEKTTEQVLTEPMVPASSTHIVTEENPKTQESEPVTEEEQISQMDKFQVSETYKLLSETFSTGSFYLEYTLNGDDYVIASKNQNVYIADEDSKLSYIIIKDKVTVCNHSDKTYREFDIGSSEFSYENYINWQNAEDYAAVEFTAVSGGTRSRPKLTETFVIDGDTLSFYYYKGVINSVTVEHFDGKKEVYEIDKLNTTVSDSLFEVNEKYNKA
jgi:hypothetical protein